MSSASLAQSTSSTTDSTIAPFRGPSGYHAGRQYYDVLNHFFSDGERVRVFARFKRIGDKRGWGKAEVVAGLRVRRARFVFEWELSQVGARLDELVKDGCQVVSYMEPHPPHGMVSYVLVSWPTNAGLERNRSARLQRKQPRQQKLPQNISPFQRLDWYERQHGPRPSREEAVRTKDECPLFAEVPQ